MQSYSPFRSTVTFKPQAQSPQVTIFHCPQCGNTFQALGYGEHTTPHCCGNATKWLEPVQEENSPQGYKITYSIVGGLNYDAVQIHWHCPEGITPAWILLKTYTGSYIRYLTPKKKAPMIFALADEDAYVYCDKKVCERCTFRCKLGFSVFVCFTQPEPLLLEVTLDKVATRYKTVY